MTLAVVRGLLQDANAVGDHQRVAKAFDGYATLLNRRGRHNTQRLARDGLAT